MRLKHLILGITAAAMMFSCSQKTDQTTVEANADAAAAEAEEISYTVDTEGSTVTWKGTMLKIKEHTGTLKIKEGSLKVKGNQITEGTFTADLKTLSTTDSNYDEKNTRENLIGHLSGADFFAVDSFPTATFVVKSVEESSITGDLTVRGKTNEEKVTDVVVENTADGVKATGKLVFDRQKYGVAWSTGAKDAILSDDIELNVELVGKK